MVILSTEMAILVHDTLYQGYGIPKRSIFDPHYREFREEDLALIERLDIINFKDISYLVHFPNLKTLNLRSNSYNEILPEMHYDDCSVINHITDFSVLSKLKGLETLVIENDVYIKELDLSGLDKLRTLIVVNNPRLTTVKGLEDLEGLNYIIMYGNAITSPIDMQKYIRNTRLSSTNIIDISMYLPMIGNTREGAKRLKDYEIASITNVKFAEKSGFLNFTKATPNNLYDMYVKLDTKLKRDRAYDLPDEDKVAYVFTYLLNNIKFLKEAVENRNAEYVETMNKYKEIPDQMKPGLASIHSGYRTYYFHGGNCEGIVNLMIFMLRMLGIEAHDVHCHDRRSDISFGSNHAVVRVHINDEIYYCDPTYDRKNANKYLLIDYETISKYHQLDSFEHQLYETSKKEEKYVK